MIDEYPGTVEAALIFAEERKLSIRFPCPEDNANQILSAEVRRLRSIEKTHEDYVMECMGRAFQREAAIVDLEEDARRLRERERVLVDALEYLVAALESVGLNHASWIEKARAALEAVKE